MSMTAGTSVQLSAHVYHHSGGVTWRANGGSINARGLYTAPAEPPRGGSVVVRATGPTGAGDRRVIVIVPVPSPQAAPAAPLPAAEQPLTSPAAQSATPGGSPSSERALPLPQAVLFRDKLIITTTVPEAGQIGLGAHLGGRSLGSCAVTTPANRGFTCRLDLVGVSPSAAIGIWARLQTGGTALMSERAPEPIPLMPMPVASPQLSNQDPSFAALLNCGPSMRLTGLSARTIAEWAGRG